MHKALALIAAGFVAAFMAAPAYAASMAPVYVSSDPQDGEELHEAPERVQVTFSEPLDESSKLSVKDSCGRKVDAGEVTIEGNTMSVEISRTPSGHYRVSYTATGFAGLTGSTEGRFHFIVHGGEPCVRGGRSNDGHGNQHGGDKGGDDSGGNVQHNNHGGGDTGAGDHRPTGHASSGGTSTHAGTSGHNGSEAPSDAKHPGTQGGGHDMTKSASGGHSMDAEPETTVDTPDGRTIAAGSGQPVAPDGPAILLALGFSLALGSVGGWFLRVSAAR